MFQSKVEIYGIPAATVCIVLYCPVQGNSTGLVAPGSGRTKPRAGARAGQSAVRRRAGTISTVDTVSSQYLVTTGTLLHDICIAQHQAPCRPQPPALL